MRFERAVHRFLFCVAIAPAAVAAQDALRAAHVGRVVDADGKPVDAAAVTFVGMPTGEGVPCDDVERTTTDRNGRFKVGLLPGVRYAAWAARRTDAGTIVSAVFERAAVTTIAFAADDTVAPERWRVNGLERWKERGAISVRLRVLGNAALLRDVSLDADGSIRLPPLPAVMCEAVFCCDRHFVHVASYSLRADTMLPPPQVVPVRVVDDDGKPVPGAIVSRLSIAWLQQVGPFADEIRGRWLDDTACDEQGTARVLVAHDQNPFLGAGYPPMTFLARCNGRSDGIAALGEGRCENGRFAPVDRGAVDAAVLTITLGKGGPQRVTCRTGASPAPTSWCAWSAVELQINEHSRTHVDEWIPCTVENGVVCLPPAAPGREVCVYRAQVPSPELPADDPFRKVAWTGTLALPPGALGEGKEIDLRTLVPMRLQVLDASGGPAIAAHVLAVPRDGNGYVNPRYGVSAVTDNSGRIVLPTLPGPWCVVAVQDATFATLVVDSQKDLAPTTVTLEPMPTMAVRVVDDSGKPVAGARLQCTSASWSSGGIDPEGDVIAALAYELSAWRIDAMRSDARGCATLPFVQNSRTRLEFQARSGELASDEMKLAACDEPVDVVVRSAR